MKSLFIIFFINIGLITYLQAQYSSESVNDSISFGPTYFPELIFTDIPGAPKLTKPKLLMGKAKPLMSEGMGWADPGVYDWNGDGKKDLLIGEFASGLQNGQSIGNFIRIYFNKGTNEAPKFSDEFKYAMNPFGVGNGSPLSIFTWCCMAFRPEFVDLDDDGYQDLVTGQFHPGEVIWFRGSSKGFFPGQKLQQEGDPSVTDKKLPITNIRSAYYWKYSSVSFGDFDDDGDFDMIIGGPGLRISKNIGSKNYPNFGIRELLLDTNGRPLSLYEEVKTQKDSINMHFPAGVHDTVPLVVDWDEDSVLDLLVTSGYYKRNQTAITFFKGVKTKTGYRFLQGVPLFFVKNGDKAFPGSWLRTYVTDWNNDGIKDLLIGASVATVNGSFDYDLSWKWEEETNIVKKNPGLFSDAQKRIIDEKIVATEKRELKLGKEEATKSNEITRAEIINHYYGSKGNSSFVHKGYIYILLGR